MKARRLEPPPEFGGLARNKRSPELPAVREGRPE
jgi:hypothetical protein